MLIHSIYSYFRGYLCITVSGNFTERFINVCAAKNILLWDIIKISNGRIRCKISVRAFRKLPQIAYKTGVRVKINAKCGFPFFIRRYRQRKLILSGGIIFLLFMIFANQFVWDIEIRGNEMVKSSDILAALEAEGLKCGIPKAKIDQMNLKTQTMLRLPSLAWLWVDKHGSKIIVEVRERLPVPEIYDPDDYCNIVASKDAVIDEMIIRNGIPVVELGDSVLKDTVLVTGKIPSPYKNDIRYVNSDAQVYARVWYEKKQEFSLISTSKTATGNKKTRLNLKLFGKEIPIFHNNKKPYENYDEEVLKYELSVFGNYLGITLVKHKYEEVLINESLETAESVIQDGAKKLKAQLDEEVLPDSVLTSAETFSEEVDETTVLVTVKAEYRENIAQKVRGEIPPKIEDSETDT